MSKSLPFPWTCPACVQDDVFPHVLPSYSVFVKDVGDVTVTDLNVAKCRACGHLVFTSDSDDQITAAARKEAT